MNYEYYRIEVSPKIEHLPYVYYGKLMEDGRETLYGLTRRAKIKYAVEIKRLFRIQDSRTLDYIYNNVITYNAVKISKDKYKIREGKLPKEYEDLEPPMWLDLDKED